MDDRRPPEALSQLHCAKYYCVQDTIDCTGCFSTVLPKNEMFLPALSVAKDPPSVVFPKPRADQAATVVGQPALNVAKGPSSVVSISANRPSIMFDA
jgi:hypothetical protein